VIGWFALPFVTRPSQLLHPAGFALGVTLICVGLAATWWCYAVMGDSWRMGIDHESRGRLITRGPFAIVRHPIYLFQAILLAGAAALLPSWLPVPILGVHLACVLSKVRDEEAHLTRLHGDDYRAYRERTPMLLPLRWPGSRLRRRRASGR
jgi:protein-S-isoprenylcysteine O-methyltransferase Ste14